MDQPAPQRGHSCRQQVSPIITRLPSLSLTGFPHWEQKCGCSSPQVSYRSPIAVIRPAVSVFVYAPTGSNVSSKFDVPLGSIRYTVSRTAKRTASRSMLVRDDVDRLMACTSELRRVASGAKTLIRSTVKMRVGQARSNWQVHFGVVSSTPSPYSPQPASALRVTSFITIPVEDLNQGNLNL